MAHGLCSTVVVSLVLASSACVDPNWGAAKRAQQSYAQRQTPHELHATRADENGDEREVPSIVPTRVMKIRAHATARYATGVVDWRRQLADLIDDTNRVLGPTVGARLELAGAEPWAPHAEDDLGAALEELAKSDPGEDVDRVVGLVGSLPRAEVSFHQLGLARMSEKFFVVRAMNDARELDAIRGLSELEEGERNQLYRARKRHKTATVFLHELGHTFGAPHEVDRSSIMHSSYDHKAEGFSPAAAELLRLGFERENQRHLGERATARSTSNPPSCSRDRRRAGWPTSATR
jgi:hypothetical protein